MSIRAVREPANAKVDPAHPILYQRTYPKPPDSIVFVHGLHGDQAPWTSEANVFWPEKLLPGKVSDARILSFEYEAAIGPFFGEDDEITDISNDLINELMDHRTEEEKLVDEAKQEERPIIFVAHCLGGVVLENALVRAAEHPRKRELIGHIHGILLLGTPHFQPASLAAATTYLQVAQAEVPSESDLKDRLKRLSGIPQRFAELKQAGAEFEVEGFYAGAGTKLGGTGKDVKIVDEALARGPDAPPPERLARNQLRLSQYDGEDDKDFKKVVRVLTQWASKIVLPEENKGAANVSNATFSGSHNSGLQLGQNVGTLKGFSFGRGSLRLNPPAPNIFPTYGITKPGMELYGKFTPAGTEVSGNPWIMQRDKQMYGEDAEESKLERWLGAEKAKLHNKYSFTFDYGARVCLGKDIAMMELYKGPLQVGLS
ncbi:hypothetical protein CNMCM6936_008746 [Aspergillus lentulus]|nr:hypothetical protein CNMCM6936_008746 [Aspergillus lentulus]